MANYFIRDGMRLGMEYALNNLGNDFDYLLMINDDVKFENNSIDKLVSQSLEQNQSIIVGAMKDENGNPSYGAIKYIKNTRYRMLAIDESKEKADTFNANCVLIPYEVFTKVGAIDENYVHSLGDLDYGLTLRNNGYEIHSSKNYVGICNKNSIKNTWGDTSLMIKDRIRKKENPKGAPTKQWFYFLKKNFGIMTAIKGCVTPYVRIMLKK